MTELWDDEFITAELFNTGLIGILINLERQNTQVLLELAKKLKYGKSKQYFAHWMPFSFVESINRDKHLVYILLISYVTLV